MKMKLIVSMTAFCITFIVSIYNNLLWTSIKRGVLAFFIFYMIASILAKILATEVQAFQSLQNQINDEQQHEDVMQTGDTQAGESQEGDQTENPNSGIQGDDDLDFQPIDFSKQSDSSSNADGMDPKVLAGLLNNFSDDNKST